jgi:outer membrane lipoprotein SlyB
MDTHQTPAARPRQHPLLIAAAIAVILFCAIGTAAIMGWLPSTKGGNRDNLTDADRAALSAGLQQPGQPLAATAPAPAYPAASATYPAALPAPAQAQAYAPSGYPVQPEAQAYAPGAAYGSSVAQGTSSGYADPARDSHPKAKEAAANDVVVNDGAERWCASCGNVESVRTITRRAQGSGVGAAGGAILGGLLGNQIGGGHGRQLATVAGAVGGAVVGNQVEGNMKASTSYEIRVRLDDGTLRTFHQSSTPRWRNGDRVRIVKGSLRAA